LRVLTRFAALLLLAGVTAPVAYAQSAVVEGVARADDGGVPVAFALVRLVRADSSALPSTSAGSTQAITNASGRYRFDGVTPGRYRVQLLRIGFRPVISDEVQVTAGETVQFSFRVASQPVMLVPVTVTADLCVAAEELGRYPQLQTLWQQARDGASVRTQLMAQFRYDVFMHEEAVARKADGSPTGAIDQRRTSDPRSAVANAARNRAQRLARGYYGQTTKDSLVSFYMPTELDVLHEDFLKAHCLVLAAQHGPAEVGLRFRPLRTRRDFLDVGGTIWLDSATFLARRIEFEYVDGIDPRGTVRLDFADVAVAGGTLRMPVGGAINLRSSRSDLSKRAESTFTITYSAFEEVRR
jgi:hypothetical protein